MAKKIEYRPEAIDEIDKAINWYDEESIGLGQLFLLDLKRAEQIIARNPLTWPIYEGKTRRYLLSRFPFGIIYLVLQDVVHIIAVAHTRRKPGYWLRRS